jgi:hypothetical protein
MNKMARLFFLLFSPFLLLGQEAPTDLIKIENRLTDQLFELRNATSDKEIKALNDSFSKTLEEALSIEDAFDHPFQNLTTIGKIYSDDKLVRLITWNIQFEDKSHDFSGFVMKKDERRDRIHVVKLNRMKQHYGMLGDQTVNHENWYGCLYYDIIDVKRRNKTVYTLLGYDPNDQRSSIKIIDALYFTGKYPNFGYPIFKSKDRLENRVILEYSNEATMSLRYDEQREKIIFDHLSPKSPSMREFREYYVPDMSYDAFEFRDDRWYLIEDIIAINKKSEESLELKSYDYKNDTVVTYKKDNDWINPESENAPIDGGKHKAALPDDLTEKEKEKLDKEERKNNKRKRSGKKGFSGVSFTNLGKEKN